MSNPAAEVRGDGGSYNYKTHNRREQYASPIKLGLLLSSVSLVISVVVLLPITKKVSKIVDVSHLSVTFLQWSESQLWKYEIRRLGGRVVPKVRENVAHHQMVPSLLKD